MTLANLENMDSEAHLASGVIWTVLDAVSLQVPSVICLRNTESQLNTVYWLQAAF